MDMRSETAQASHKSGTKSSSKSSSTLVKPQRGRLLGVTAAGPIYLGQQQIVVVPVASVLATLQELARRVDDPDAQVTSSIAGRVCGKAAYDAWLEMSLQSAVQLTTVTLGGRLKFLRFLLKYIAHAGRVEGLEPLLATAVNAAWPAMSSQTMSSTLSLTSTKLRKSKFAEKNPIPVLDVNRRIAGFFGPGELARIDLEEWRAQRDLGADGYDGLPDGLSGKLRDGLKSPLERALDEIFGGTGEESLEDAAKGLMPGGDTKGVPGGLPSAGDLPGQGDKSKPQNGNSLEDIAAGLGAHAGSSGVPGGLPSIGDLPGQKGADTGLSLSGLGRSGTKAEDLLSSIPGSDYKGVSGFLQKHGTSGFKTGIFEGATPGGPFAPPGQLGIHGSGGEGWDDWSRTEKGAAVTAVGAAILVFAGETGAGLVVGGGVALIGLAMMAKGGTDPPKPEKPQRGDLYPDPLGGGGGNPTQSPAFDEQGGGRPNTMPDYEGHGGGTPNTIFGKPDGAASIWDETYGGHGPTVRPQTFSIPALVGPGLMAEVVQVGPTAIRY